MPLLETHVRPACVGVGALGLFRLASTEGSPGKLNIVVPSVKKSTYFEPTTCTRFSAGFPLAWLTEEVADAALAVDHLAALLGLHPGAEPDLTGTLDVAALVRVMHCRSVQLSLSSLRRRRRFDGDEHVFESLVSAGVGGSHGNLVRAWA